MIRERNPETWFASWASSAPVEAQLDMSVYFNPMQQSMPNNCTADVHAAVTYADGILLNGTQREVNQLREAIYMTALVNPMVNTTSGEPAPPASMELYDIAQLLGYAFEGTTTDYQSNGFNVALRPFCDYIEKYNPSSSGGLPTNASTNSASGFVQWLNNTADSTPTGRCSL